MESCNHTRPDLVVLDGAKGAQGGGDQRVRPPVIARCQLHKIRSVTDRLPDQLASTVAKRMCRAYHADSALVAEASSKPSPKNSSAPTPAPPRRCVKARPKR